MPLPVPVQRSDDRLDLLAGDRAGAKQGDAAVQHGDHSALDPDRAVAAVQGRRRKGAGLLDRVGEGRGAGAARTVGRRRDDGPPEGGDDGPGTGMAGHPHGHAVQTGASQVADPVAVADGGHDRQGPRPEGLGKGPRPGVEHGDGFGLNGVSDMGDQGVEARPPLGLEDAGHSDGVSGVGAEAIDRLGGQDDKPAVGERANGPGVGHGQPRCA